MRRIAAALFVLSCAFLGAERVQFGVDDDGRFSAEAPHGSYPDDQLHGGWAERAYQETLAGIHSDNLHRRAGDGDADSQFELGLRLWEERLGPHGRPPREPL